MSEPPKIGEIVHVNMQDELPAITNLPCRVAIISGEEREGSWPAHIIPAWSTAYNANIKVWHRIEDCKR